MPQRYPGKVDHLKGRPHKHLHKQRGDEVFAAFADYILVQAESVKILDLFMLSKVNQAASSKHQPAPFLYAVISQLVMCLLTFHEPPSTAFIHAKNPRTWNGVKRTVSARTCTTTVLYNNDWSCASTSPAMQPALIACGHCRTLCTLPATNFPEPAGHLQWWMRHTSSALYQK